MTIAVDWDVKNQLKQTNQPKFSSDTKDFNAYSKQSKIEMNACQDKYGYFVIINALV